MKKNKILVTGAKGFVGEEIANFLKREYEKVFTLENERANKSRDLPISSDVFFADITNKTSLRQLEKIEAIDAVVHSAGLAHQFGATSREVFQKVNVAGTENVLLLARKLGVRHFILISSVAVYGHAKNKPRNEHGTVAGIDEDSECAPEDFYAESKLDGEKAARAICEEAGIRLTILRPATIVGEQDPGNFLRLIRVIDRGVFVWIGRGENYKSFVHREDVARACAAVLAGEGAGTEIFNLSANFLRMKDVVRMVSDKLEKKVSDVFIPPTLSEKLFRFNGHFFGFGKVKRWEQTVAKWLADDVYSAEKIKRKYNFTPRISAEQAVEREVEWYKTNNRK